jgi:hypothetical protein
MSAEERAALGHNVGGDHVVPREVRIEQRTPPGMPPGETHSYYGRRVSRIHGEECVLVEQGIKPDGTQTFGDALYWEQLQVTEQVRDGRLAEGPMLAEYQNAYARAAATVNNAAMARASAEGTEPKGLVTVNEHAVNRSIITNHNVLHRSADTAHELSRSRDPTTVTEATIDRAFTPYDPAVARSAAGTSQSVAAASSGAAVAPAAHPTRAPATSPPMHRERADVPHAEHRPAGASVQAPHHPAGAAAATAAEEVKATVAGVVEGAPSAKGWVAEALESAAAGLPKSLSEAKAAAVAYGPELAETAGRVAGAVVAGIGAAKEANDAYEFGIKGGMGRAPALVWGDVTAAATTIAGYVDGVAAGSLVLAPLEAEHVKDHGSGALQHLVGGAIQAAMAADMHVERRVGEALTGAAHHVASAAHDLVDGADDVGDAARHAADAARHVAEQAWQAIHPASHG